MRLALVACSGKKLDGERPAQDMYISPLFRKARAWAENNADAWRILSAFHNLLEPSTVIGTYDRTLSKMRTAEREFYYNLVFQSVRRLVATGDTVVMLCGRLYHEDVTWRLRRQGITVETPLEGLGIGQQMAWLAVRP